MIIELNKLQNKVVWSFNGKKYESLEQFITDINEYNQKILKKEFKDFPFINSKVVEIQYMGIPDNEKDYDDELSVKLESYKPIGFTFAELLFKFQNKINKHLNPAIADHIFFEGFELIDDNIELPVLLLIQGS